MRILASATFAALTAIAALHIYWGLGGLWPASSTQELIATVIGAPGMTRMPPLDLTSIVAGMIFASGVFALASRLRSAGLVRWFIRIALAVITLVILGRAVAGFIAPARAIVLSEPFAALDRLFYSPLCLAFAVAFALLLVSMPTRQRQDGQS